MRRTSSQNVVFHGISRHDDPLKPPGRSIATAILRGLRADGYFASDEENWRDCGWSIEVGLIKGKLQVAIAETCDPNQWIAQVALVGQPGIMAKLFGRRFIDHSDEVLSVAWFIDRCLRHAGYVDLLWRLDGFPDCSHGAPFPVGPLT